MIELNTLFVAIGTVLCVGGGILWAVVEDRRDARRLVYDGNCPRCERRTVIERRGVYYCDALECTWGMDDGDEVYRDAAWLAGPEPKSYLIKGPDGPDVFKQIDRAYAEAARSVVQSAFKRGGMVPTGSPPPLPRTRAKPPAPPPRSTARDCLSCRKLEVHRRLA